MLIGADALVPIDATAAACTRDPHAFVSASVLLRVAGAPCAVHFDDAEAAGRFANRYADLIDDAARPAFQTFTLRDPQFGSLFWWEGGPVLRWPHGALPPEGIAFLADAVAMTGLFATRADGMLTLHAAAVGIAGRAAAIVGDTNVGKTTTAIACGRIGMQLYSDERCIVDARGLVHPFPRALGIRAPGLALLLRDAAEADDAVDERLRAQRDAASGDAVRLRDLFPDWQIPAPASLRAVFVLTGSAEHVGLAAAPASRAVQATIRWAQGAGEGLDKVARLYALFNGAACFTLRLGPPDASARAIRETLLAMRAEIGKSA